MDETYASCRTCAAMVVPPSAYAARVDGAAQLHARTTGHPVDVLSDSDPDVPLYVVPGEPGLYAVGPGA